MRASLALVAPVLVAAACSAGWAGCTSSPIDTSVADMAMTPPAPDLYMPPPPPDLWWDHSLVTKRPYKSTVPASYDKSVPMPLVLALHGLGDTGANFASELGLTRLANTKGFLLAYPDGTTSSFGNYWNAIDACCGQLGNQPPPDDVAYLDAVLSDMIDQYNVDPKRIFLIGLSNGAMMSHRLACDLSTRVAAIVSISGVQYNDTSLCKPTEGVGVMEIHGTADTTVPYDGGPLLGQAFLPSVGSAQDTINVWVGLNKCSTTADTSAAPVDLDGSLPGAETTIAKYPDCEPGGAAELWTVKGGMHVPQMNADIPGKLYDWLAAHAKPAVTQ